MRGSKPKPTEIKELQGTLQPCRTNPLEPKLKKKSKTTRLRRTTYRTAPKFIGNS